MIFIISQTAPFMNAMTLLFATGQKTMARMSTTTTAQKRAANSTAIQAMECTKTKSVVTTTIETMAWMNSQTSISMMTTSEAT